MLLAEEERGGSKERKENQTEGRLIIYVLDVGSVLAEFNGRDFLCTVVVVVAVAFIGRVRLVVAD